LKSADCGTPDLDLRKCVYLGGATKYRDRAVTKPNRTMVESWHSHSTNSKRHTTIGIPELSFGHGPPTIITPDYKHSSIVKQGCSVACSPMKQPPSVAPGALSISQKLYRGGGAPPSLGVTPKNSHAATRQDQTRKYRSWHAERRARNHAHIRIDELSRCQRFKVRVNATHDQNGAIVDFQRVVVAATS